MPSFDITSEVDKQELDNAVNQAAKELATRFDFKGSNARIELDLKESKIKLSAEDASRVRGLHDIVIGRLSKRGVDLRNVEAKDPAISPLGHATQELAVKQGLDGDKAKEIVKAIKEQGFKVPEDDLQAVIAYVQSFSRRWRKPENYAEPMQLPAPPAWFHDEPGKAEQAAAGRGLFLQHCATCHGPEADGRGPAAAMLRDVWNQPAKPSDLREPHLRCGSRPEDLYRLLATGMNGTPMISFETLLTPEQRWTIVAWIFSQKRAEAPTLGVAPPRELPASAPKDGPR